MKSEDSTAVLNPVFVLLVFFEQILPTISGPANALVFSPLGYFLVVAAHENLGDFEASILSWSGVLWKF